MAASSKSSASWDIEADLWMQTEFERVYVAPPKPSIHVLKGRSSLFNELDHHEECEKEATVKTIRGRPVKIKPHDTKPGGSVSNFSEWADEEALREVSGLGYSNDLIERTISKYQEKAQPNSPKNGKIPTPDLNFKLTSSSSSNKSSKSSITNSSRTDSDSLYFSEPNNLGLQIDNTKEFPTLK